MKMRRSLEKPFSNLKSASVLQYFLMKLFYRFVSPLSQSEEISSVLCCSVGVVLVIMRIYIIHYFQKVSRKECFSLARLNLIRQSCVVFRETFVQLEKNFRYNTHSCESNSVKVLIL